MSDTATQAPRLVDAVGAAVTAKAEANGAKVEAIGDPTIEITYNGVSYTFPSSLDGADYAVLEAMDLDKLSFALKGLLDPTEYRKFKATKPKFRDAGELFATWARAIGLEEVGE